jgi:hypothetical protein
VSAALQETLLGLFVRAIDLEVVFEFAFASQACVERLRVLVIGIAVALEEAAPVPRQAHRMVAVSGHARRLDPPLFARVPQVARAWISGTAIVVAEITTGDHSERANGRERSRFGGAQRVLAISIVHQLAIASAWQVKMARERVPDLGIAFACVPVAVGPTGIPIAVSSLHV